MAKNWNLFPSPRGDKLQRTRILTKRKPKSFRPLAGINCNYKSGEYMVWTDGFPSPRGDKLQPSAFHRKQI